MFLLSTLRPTLIDIPVDIKNGMRNRPDSTRSRSDCNVEPSNGSAPQTNTYSTTPSDCKTYIHSKYWFWLKSQQMHSKKNTSSSIPITNLHNKHINPSMRCYSPHKTLYSPRHRFPDPHNVSPRTPRALRMAANRTTLPANRPRRKNSRIQSRRFLSSY